MKVKLISARGMLLGQVTQVASGALYLGGINGKET